MLERIKTGILVVLVLSSIILTYRVWFGVPPLEDGKMTGYEYLYFADPYLPEEIVTPSEIIFTSKTPEPSEPAVTSISSFREEHVFKPGEEEYRRFWAGGVSLLKSLKYQDINVISDEDRVLLNRETAVKISFCFSISLPLAFLVPELSSLALEIRRVDFFPNGENCLVLLEGEEVFAANILMSFVSEETAGFFYLQKPCLYYCLPDVLTLDLSGSGFLLSDGPLSEAEVGEEGAAASGFVIQQGIDGVEKDNEYFLLEINNKGELRVPLGDLQASEIILEKEYIDRDQLVKALFFDQSMARRIEERDGAVFFTDGEKGLRIYPDGLIEYTAPKLEQPSLSISFNTVLQKGTENLSLFGGWFPETYLTGAERQSQGYRLIWKNYFNGLPLQGDNAGSEMWINEQGVFFYQRNFYNLPEGMGDIKSFRSFEEALAQAVFLYKEFSLRDDGVLLEIEPVYYLTVQGEKNVVATPAWCISFEGMEKLYLHWLTLNPL